MAIELSSKQVSEINNYYINNFDKNFRKYAGLSSELVKVKNNTIFLRIDISSQWERSPIRTAIQFLNGWRLHNEILKKAHFYKVALFHSSPPGFVIPIKKDNIKGTIYEVNQGIKSLEKYEKEESPFFIFSNLNNKYQESNDEMQILKTTFRILSFKNNNSPYLGGCDFLDYQVNNIEDFYNEKMLGIPAYIKISESHEKSTFYPALNISNILDDSNFAIIDYIKNQNQGNRLSKISMYRKLKGFKPILINNINPKHYEGRK